MPAYESTLREFLRQYMDAANTNAREESGNGGRTFDMRDLDRMSMAEMLRFVKDNGLRPGMEGGNSRLGEVAIGEDDPAVAQFLEQYGAKDWGDVEAPDSGNRRARGFVRGYGDPSYGRGEPGESLLADGSRILRLPDGTYIREEANINSDEVAGRQRADETQSRQSMQALARVLAGPAMGAAAGYLGAAGDMGSVMAAAPGQGFGTAAGTASNLGGAVGAAGSMPGVGSGASAPRVNVPGDLAMNPGGATGTALDAMPTIQQAGGAGGLSGLGQAASGGASVPGDMALSTGGGASTALDAMPAIQQAGSGSSMLGQAYNAVGGAQGIARMGLGLASLGAASSGGGGSGGETDPQNIIEQMANANRVDQNTPIGSRRWSQDPATGRWTVNDSMSPTEQANFEGVQGLNSSVTQMARDRLAALLAKPTQRYDRPLGS